MMLSRLNLCTSYSCLAPPRSTTSARYAVTGVCLVGLYMVVESWLNALAPSRQRGRIFAAYMAVTLVAMALGQFLILVGESLGFTPFALVSILLSLALVPVALTRVAEPAAVEAPALGLPRLFRLSPLGVVGALASGLLNGAFFGMGAVFASRIGLSGPAIAAFMSATIIGGALLQWPVGHLSDRHDRSGVLVGVCFCAAALAAAGFVLARLSQPGLIAAAFCYGGLVFAVYGLSVALVNDCLAPGEVLEATSGLLLLHGLGATVGPLAAGLLMDVLGPGSLLLYFVLVLVLTGSFGVYRMRLGPQRPAAEQRGFVAMAGSSQAVLAMDPGGRPNRGPSPGSGRRAGAAASSHKTIGHG